MSARTCFLAWLCAASLALVGCGRAAETESSAPAGSPEAEPLARPHVPADIVPADAPLVVFLGDSISAGLHVEPDSAFPAVLQRELVAAGHPFRLVNAGVSGDTSAGGLRRVDWLLKQAPDVLVLELGGNDALRGQPVLESEARLREIITRATASGARVMLLGLRLPPSLGADYVHAFEAIYPRLATELGCAFVPFFMDGAAGDPAQMQDDGIHPNARGHVRLAENVAPRLTELLDALRTLRTEPARAR